MKRVILICLCVLGVNSFAQTNQDLIKHYEAYYKQMKNQGDVQGVISGLTHLNVLAPTQARQDTLAMIYMSEGKYIQALNTIGIDHKVDDSDIAVEVKAVSLKSINEYERSIVHFEELYKRNPEVSVAYELAEVYLQTQKLDQATKYTEFGLANSKDNMGKTFYETQQPYQVPVKAAFMYLKALIKFNENKTENIDAAVAILDEALKLAPNFNLAQLSKNALLQQKPQPEKKN
ncbi:tetratricopeptide repeat protein [Hanstruepera ponticola]|uniref:tetratricopeptide repeat protein n=1 Tax=Hanstruepera ponticola TaxID=2042995 RepID=UPI00178660B7|nr:hypothetical protein [Hanstruepera ponticola]